ncbi:MAG: IS30 family transposase, partial [Lawsonibacter sp.]|nr:IS30 family transposase [Lawsonibacter sp.]
LALFEVPDVLKRRQASGGNRINKRPKGRSIEKRPDEVAARAVLGHWEADTVVGLRNGKEAVAFTLVERVTDNYIAVQIPGKTSEAVQAAMQLLHTEFGDHFSNVFKTITADNGSEFEDFAQTEQWGRKVYFAHPYSSWERPVNERHNGMLRGFTFHHSQPVWSEDRNTVWPDGRLPPFWPPSGRLPL